MRERPAATHARPATRHRTGARSKCVRIIAPAATGASATTSSATHSRPPPSAASRPVANRTPTASANVSTANAYR